MEQHETLESFFWEKLGSALRDQRVETAAVTEHYLVQLLAAYAHAPRRRGPPLALKLLAAQEAAAANGAASCARSATRRCSCRASGPTASPGGWSTSTTTSAWAARPTASWPAGDGWGRTRTRCGEVFEELADKFARFVTVLRR